MEELILRARRVVTPSGVIAACVHIAQGRIVAITSFDSVVSAHIVENVPDHLVLMPGLVDTHVHINEPGRTHWEGFSTATRAAAAGGVTTLVDMPLNSIPPTTSSAGLAAKAQAAEGKLWVDLGLCGGLIPGNAHALSDLVREGAVAFKCFLSESGVDEFPCVAEEHLREALPIIEQAGVPLLVHAELSGPIDAVLSASTLRGSPTPAELARYVTYLESRPRAAENEAVDLMVRLTRDYRARTHIVHLSSSDALLVLRDARDEGLPISAETCPHYLHLTAEEVPDGATSFKCAPPIRERENRERLWRALGEGTLHQVVTDHSPSTPELKCSDSGDFMRAWGGISSLQLGLAVVWTEARSRGHALTDVSQWMSAAPARLVGIHARKGMISVGHDADLIAFDPEARFEVDPHTLEHRHPVTPYTGQSLFGRVRTTWLRGSRIFHEGTFGLAPTGRRMTASQ